MLQALKLDGQTILQSALPNYPEPEDFAADGGAEDYDYPEPEDFAAGGARQDPATGAGGAGAAKRMMSRNSVGSASEEFFDDGYGGDEALHWAWFWELFYRPPKLMPMLGVSRSGLAVCREPACE